MDTTTPAAPDPRLAAWSESFWEDEALPVLSSYVTIPCLSPEYDEAWEEAGHIGRAAELLLEWASGRSIEGLRVELSQLPGLTPVILAEVDPFGEGGEGPPVLLYGHFDKQPPLGSWREGLGAFEPVRQGDRLYGRGTADDGYSIFAALGAIELAQRSGRGHPRCIVIIEGSEESGSPHLPAYLEALSGRLGPDGPRLVVCLDSGAASYDRLWMTTSLRGLLAATVRVQVLREGIHSGLGGAVIPDSFRLLRQLLSRIEDAETGEVLLPSCQVEVPARRRAETADLVAQLGETAEGFPSVPGLRLAGGKGPLEQALARCWEASLAFVGIEGVPPIEEAGNVLRPYTAAKISIRIPPSADSARAASELSEALLSNPPEGAEVTVSDLVAADGFDAPATAEWLERAAEEASAAFFGEPSGAMGEGGTIPFLAALLGSYPAAQFLVTGVLGPESNAHGPNEMLHIPTAKRLTASVAHVLSATAASTNRGA